MHDPDILPLRRAVTVFLILFSQGFSGCRTVEKGAPPVSGAIDQPTFALIDADGDGKVSAVEMAAFKHEEGLAEVDLDNDKRISQAEWKAARPSAPPDDGTFGKLDLNHDGLLAADEAIAHVTAQTAYRDGFKKMDANGDGFLHWEEYVAGDADSLNVSFFSAGSHAAPTGNAG